MEPGSTVEVDAVEDARGRQGEGARGQITIKAPSSEREAVGVGAKGGCYEDGASCPRASDGGDLPDEPEVLPDVPDAPPAAEGETKPE